MKKNFFDTWAFPILMLFVFVISLLATAFFNKRVEAQTVLSWSYNAVTDELTIDSPPLVGEYPSWNIYYHNEIYPEPYWGLLTQYFGLEGIQSNVLDDFSERLYENLSPMPSEWVIYPTEILFVGCEVNACGYSTNIDIVPISAVGYGYIDIDEYFTPTPTPEPPQLFTGIEIWTPQDESVQTSNLVNFSGQWNKVVTNDPADYTFNAIEIEITNIDTSSTWSVWQAIPIGLNAVRQSWSNTQNLVDGDYSAKARLYNTITETFTDWSDTITFEVANVGDDGVLVPQEECEGWSLSLENIICRIRNLLVTLFVPSNNALQSFNNLGVNFSEKAPFGYFVQTRELLNIDTSGTAAFTVATIEPIQVYIFNPLREALFWVTILAGLVYLFIRAKRMKLD